MEQREIAVGQGRIGDDYRQRGARHQDEPAGRLAVDESLPEILHSSACHRHRGGSSLLSTTVDFSSRPRLHPAVAGILKEEAGDDERVTRQCSKRRQSVAFTLALHALH
jgi:hypothetical protein